MLSTLTNKDKNDIQELLAGALDIDTLEEIFSLNSTLLGFQDELLNYTGAKKHKRLVELCLHMLGDSLLRNELIRNSFSIYKNIPSLKKWRPGSKSAVNFCKALNISTRYAGLLSKDDTRPFLSYVPTTSKLILADYQKEVLENCLESLKNSNTMLSLPTGGGKTYVATNLLHKFHINLKRDVTSIWIAHTEELCDQAARTIYDTWSDSNEKEPLIVLRAWGRQLKKLTDGELYEEIVLADHQRISHKVIVTTPHTAKKLLEDEKNKLNVFRINNLKLIIIDEAHRAAAQSYKDVLKYSSKISDTQIPVLGLSATPVRETYSSHKYKGTEELAKLFNNLVEPYQTLGKNNSPTEALQERGFLSKLNTHKIQPSIKTPKELSKHIYEILKDKNTKNSILFTPDISSSKVMATYLNEIGLSCEHVSSQSPEYERQLIIKNMREHKIDVLCNCEILTTGFDAPHIENIFLARNTNSPVLYKQIIGRGLRGPKFGGTETCNLYLCGISLPFEADPNTSDFARSVWNIN